MGHVEKGEARGEIAAASRNPAMLAAVLGGVRGDCVLVSLAGGAGEAPTRRRAGDANLGRGSDSTQL